MEFYLQHQDNSSIDNFNSTVPGKNSLSTENKTEIFRIKYFTPLESIVIVLPLISLILLIIVLKLAFATMVKTTGLNKYDLIIFKSTESKAKNSILIGRKMFDNHSVIQHNIKASQEAGFDINRIKSITTKRINMASH